MGRSEGEWFARLCERIRQAVPLAPAKLDRRTALAFHEAAHAVVDHANELSVPRLSIVGAEGRAFTSASGPAVEAVLDGGTPGTVAPFVQGALAGILAEAMVTSTPLWAHAYADLVFAKTLADGTGSSAGEAAARLAQCIEDAKRVLNTRWASVSAVAALLGERGEVGEVELETMLKHP